MHRARSFLPAAAALAVLSGLAVALAAPGANADEKVQYLYVQTAHAVSAKGDTLTLYGVGPTTLYFSDRPERIAGHGTTAEVVKTWSEGEDSFAKDPPNATLSILGDGAEEVDDIVVELSNPKLSGSELIYTVKVIDGKLPASGGPSSLFIDIIGRPLTPMSVAGVGRRVTRRTFRRRVW